MNDIDIEIHKTILSGLVVALEAENKQDIIEIRAKEREILDLKNKVGLNKKRINILNYYADQCMTEEDKIKNYFESPEQFREAAIKFLMDSIKLKTNKEEKNDVDVEKE